MKNILKIAVLISILLAARPVAKLCVQENRGKHRPHFNLSRQASLDKYTGKSPKDRAQGLLKNLQRKE